VPTYYPCPSISDREPRFGFNTKEFSYGRGAPWKVGARDFGVWVSASAECPEGSNNK